MSKRKIPEFVICASCKRRLDPSRYQEHPGDDTPQENITVIIDPNLPRFSMSCTCGHYTVFRTK